MLAQKVPRSRLRHEMGLGFRVSGLGFRAHCQVQVPTEMLMLASGLRLEVLEGLATWEKVPGSFTATKAVVHLQKIAKPSTSKHHSRSEEAC